VVARFTGARVSRADATVLIAAGEELEALRHCLEALAGQSLDPLGYEVVVALYDRLLDARPRVEAHVAPFALAVVALRSRSRAEALNHGLNIASGSYCVVLADHVVPGRELLAKHLTAQQERGSVMGLGRVETTPRAHGGRRRRAQAPIREPADLRAASDPTWRDCDGRNFCVPTAALRACGGFTCDGPLAAAELACRLRETGTRLAYVRDAVVACEDPRTRAEVVADTERRGRESVRLAARESEMLPGLLGAFGDGGSSELRVRRLLLALRVPPRAALAAADLLAPLTGQAHGDAFILRYAFWAGVRGRLDPERWRRLTRGAPILMYHAFARRGERASRFVISRRRFFTQMLALRLLRYRVLALEDVARSVDGKGAWPRRAVAITIDDGYRDNFDVAYPILRWFGYPATIFLVSAKLGGKHDRNNKDLIGRPLLDLPLIRVMAAGDVRFGAHTRTHPSLTSLLEAGVRDEVGGSRDDLQRALGAPVEAFAFPYGDWDERSVRAARDAGFLAACTVRSRPSYADGRPLLIDRIEICGRDSLVVFLRKLRSGAGR
jgi:peptidoglycan/xylan/chitin deacetylase (PgdA/CDA1 family)